jgi:hypothetical protein
MQVAEGSHPATLRLAIFPRRNYECDATVEGPAGEGVLVVTAGDQEIGTVLPKQADLLGLRLPVCMHTWCDVQLMYREHFLRPRCGVLLMLSELGLPLRGSQHRARDDVTNLVALLRALADSGCRPERTGSTDGRIAAYLGDTPDLALARLALLLAGQPDKDVASCLKAMRCGPGFASVLLRVIPGGRRRGVMCRWSTESEILIEPKVRLGSWAVWEGAGWAGTKCPG